jgi:predicted PurR-regulated permease PerM
VAAALFGFLGVAFVVPLTAAAKILISRLYVERALGHCDADADAATE